MELGNFYPPTKEKLTAAQLAISDSIKISDIETQRQLVGIFLQASELCYQAGDRQGEEAYMMLVESRLKSAMVETGNLLQFRASHS